MCVCVWLLLFFVIRKTSSFKPIMIFGNFIRVSCIVYRNVFAFILTFDCATVTVLLLDACFFARIQVIWLVLSVFISVFLQFNEMCCFKQRIIEGIPFFCTRQYAIQFAIIINSHENIHCLADRLKSVCVCVCAQRPDNGSKRFVIVFFGSILSINVSRKAFSIFFFISFTIYK